MFLKSRLQSSKYDATQGGTDSILELKKKLDLNIIKYEVICFIILYCIVDCHVSE